MNTTDTDPKDEPGQAAAENDQDRAEEELPHHEIEGAASDDERVEEAIDESFPASDPPSWTSGVDHHES